MYRHTQLLVTSIAALVLAAASLPILAMEDGLRGGVADIHGLVRTAVVQGQYPGNHVQTAPNGPEFGHSVAIQGDWMVVGAPGATFALGVDPAIRQHGMVLVFRKVGGSWQQTQQIYAAISPSGGDGPRCGHAVALRMPHLAIGCPYTSANERGMVRLYKFNEVSQTFELNHTITSPEADGENRCGWSLAMTRNYLAIGCPVYRSDESGRVRVFRRDSTADTFTIAEGHRLPPSPTPGMAFGQAVAMYEPNPVSPGPNFVRLAIGAPNTVYDGSIWPRGTVFIYHRAVASAQWVNFTLRRPAPVGTDGATLAGFGAALAMNHSQLVVGAPNNRFGVIQTLPGPGSVHRFSQALDGTWSTQDSSSAGNVPDGVHAGMRFGAAVALGHDSLIAIGAPGTKGRTTGGSVAEEVGLVETRRTASGDWAVVPYYGEMRPSPLSVSQHREGRFGTAIDFDAGHRRMVVGYPRSGTVLAPRRVGSVWVYEPDLLFANGFQLP